MLSRVKMKVTYCIAGVDLLKYGLTAALLGFTHLGPSVFLVGYFYYNSVKCGPFVTQFCTQSATDNVNKCCKFGYCMISTFSCVRILWLNRTCGCMCGHYVALLCWLILQQADTLQVNNTTSTVSSLDSGFVSQADASSLYNPYHDPASLLQLNHAQVSYYVVAW